jgi:hypothetical protein
MFIVLNVAGAGALNLKHPSSSVVRNMNHLRHPGIPFLIIGLSFLVIDLNGRNAFLAIGAAFIALGIIFRTRTAR